MSVFAVNEILTAEQSARTIKEEAASRCKAIIADAGEEGEKLISDAEKTASDTARKIKIEAEKKIKLSDNAANADVERKIAALKAQAVEKFPAALGFIKKNLI